MNGRTPLQHFMAIMNNPRAEKKRRDFAAAQLMSFMHPRLAPVVNAPQGKTSEDTAQEIRDALRAMHAATAPPPPAPTPEIKPTPAAASPRAQPKAQDAPPPPAQRGLPIRPKRSAAGD